MGLLFSDTYEVRYIPEKERWVISKNDNYVDDKRVRGSAVKEAKRLAKKNDAKLKIYAKGDKGVFTSPSTTRDYS